ncbi:MULTISPECIES: GNAT family N-acetyltransferase [unclassified Mycobacterium]|uniref:GNAT family N-acetyltransferase n=1 Tax=unclassified Mycobacterium TaxID=2642494 RepID=UPI0008017EA2|nr:MULTISPECIES: GNAT family N-acetyltransferase [unclassified Mycobacterium]OBG74967.1 acetyltransferase [Mycobacterium sp. E1214]OBH23929.1 acetyltransferase [Mycobacterium sp. E1319]
MATTPGANLDVLEFVVARQHDAVAAAQFEGLAAEYAGRYGGDPTQLRRELFDYPAEEFEPPTGVLVVALCNQEPVAGGALRRYDSKTAELKRIWTTSAHRRRGYGRLVVAELERRALLLGYTRVYLTTGWRQPEAVALYVSAGYTPLYDPRIPAAQVGPHPFEKRLTTEDAG